MKHYIKDKATQGEESQRTGRPTLQKPRILLLLHELSLTGASKVILDIFRELSADFSIQMITVAGGPLEQQFRGLGQLTILSEHIVRPSMRRRAIRATKEGFRAALSYYRAKRWNPDIIYVNSVAALPLLRQLPSPAVPVILHVHEMGTVLKHFSRACHGLLQKSPSRYLAVSEAVKQALCRDHGVLQGNISVIHECVRPQDFATPQLKPWSARKNGSPLVIGGAGRIAWAKGNSLWLQMALELTKLMGDNNVRFVWVGVSDDIVGWQFREEAEKLGIAPLIEFVPVTSDPLNYFSNFDVFALTSFEDPCPIVVLECMLLGKPVVCFGNSGGASEEVGNAGVVVSGFSPSAMAQAVVDLTTSSERMSTLGRAARQRVLDHFTCDQQVQKIKGDIFDLIGTSRNA